MTKPFILSIAVTVLFLVTGCEPDPPDNDNNSPYIKASVNGTAWETSTLSVTTLDLGSGPEPVRITGSLSGSEISIGIVNSNPNIFTFKNNRPNPVMLLNFTGAIFESGHRLRWNTATETNLSSFIIETSIDGLTWTTVTTVAATGSNSSYETTIQNTPPSGVGSYYRLKMVNTDTTFQYSTVLVISGASYASYKAADGTIRRGYDGTIEVTGLDKPNRTITGRFLFKTKSETGQLYNITNGEFRATY